MSEEINNSSQQAGAKGFVERRKNHLAGMSKGLDDFSRSFEASARRWELVVYPSLFAFIILAAYGFFLIYRLTSDVNSITDKMVLIATNMEKVSHNMAQMTGSIQLVATEVSQVRGTMEDMLLTVVDMNEHVGSLDNSAENLLISLDAINQSVHGMTVTLTHIRSDMSVMTYNMHNVAKPMKFMNNFVPW